jgi:hypothetical protein
MKQIKLNFDEQIRQAFDIKPDISGIIHGNQRRVLRGAPYRIVSLFTSRKSGGGFLLESVPEAIAALCIESSSAVSRFVTQSFRVTLSERHFVLPDFLIERTDGSYLVVEIKASLRGLSREDVQRYDLCAKLLDREGIEFRIFDSYMLPDKFNFLKLKQYHLRGHQRVWSDEAIDIAMNILENASSEKIQAGRLRLIKEGIPSGLADFLVFHKKLSFSDAVNNCVEIAA